MGTCVRADGSSRVGSSWSSEMEALRLAIKSAVGDASLEGDFLATSVSDPVTTRAPDSARIEWSDAAAEIPPLGGGEEI